MSFRKKKCFRCLCEGKDLEVGDEYFMYPLDRPYVNIFFHRACYKEVEQNIVEFLAQNQKILYTYIEK